MRRIATFVILLGMTAAIGAQQMQGQGNVGDRPMATGGAGEMADGEIRKVNKDAKKLTIRHGPIPSMDMPPMTMVYQVKDDALLDQVKDGDKVKFTAEKIGGAYVVTRIAPAN